ncbi:MAG: response regulator [Erythrobacter sp.]|nr:response regulator [Erythrobacter sp.]RZV36100.1 MAG: response regulator [Sphingomonadaceae bacterium]
MKELSPTAQVRLEPDPPTSLGSVADPAPLRVLLAEDTRISAEMLQAMSDRLSIKMDIVANGLEAIEAVQSAIAANSPYSLLLLDIMMPILDGIETATRLRADGISAHELPIIAITASANIEEVRTYRQAGMQAFLEKPVSLDSLRATMQAWGHRSPCRVRAMRPAAFDALAGQFRQRKVTTLAALRTALETGDLSEKIIVELRRILHQLAGTAGSFGETELGEEARQLEIELMATFFESGNLREVIERAALAIERRI